MLRKFELVVLAEDVINRKLKAGDVGIIATVLGEAKAYEVEFVTYTGETLAVETLMPHQIRSIRASEIMTARDTSVLH